MSRRPVTRATGEAAARVGNAELFFDLVYVFAVTQLSHYLLAHPDPTGLAQTAVLFGAVWWAWNYMAWATNWLDPDRVAVRAIVFAMMLVGLAMSASIPRAFGAYGWFFALAYSGSQVVRTGVEVLLLRRSGQPALALNLTRAMLWFCATAPLWAAGALSDGDTRLALWAAALAIEIAAPSFGFWLPRLGRSDTREFGVSGRHMAERCGLFIIVALGEGIVVTGTTAAGLPLTGPNLAAFVVAFLGSVAMWWIYFDRGAEKGSEHIAHAADSGRVARGAYSYLHIPIVAGIIVGAVGDEMVLMHPLGHLDASFVATAIGGPALFLAGTMRFKRAFTGFHPLSHLVGLLALGLLAFAAPFLHSAPVVLGGCVVAVLIGVAVWEWGSFHGGWSQGPMPERIQTKARKAKQA